MHRSLPPRPSLAQLKHQAKDLRTDAREGDRDAIGILRRLRQFQSQTDQQIASANVALSDAQYALAMEYGFASWPALKQHVESLTGNAHGAVRRDDGSVIIDGFQRARWGGGTRRQNSNIAVLALISEALGDDVDYDFLMGATGAAFRIQVFKDQLCPSSPHANCGFKCIDRAPAAWGREIDWVYADDKHEANRAPARSRIIQSIEQGIPVLASSEECDLIVGFRGDEFLLRKYSAREEGYVPMQKWPWALGFVAARRQRPDPMRLLRESFALARQLFQTPEFDGYASGKSAYRRWTELLCDESRFKMADAKELFIPALGNAFIFDCLADARGAASNYLSAAAEMFPDAAAEQSRHAAEAFAQIERTLRENRMLAPYPWDLPSLADWTPVMRRRETEFIRTVAEHDAAAMQMVGSLADLRCGPR